MNVHVSPTNIRTAKVVAFRPASAKSPLEKAIADHKTATRLVRNRTADLDKLFAAHPDLESGSPLVHFWTKQDGTKCYGRCLDDYNKIFPTSLDHISPGNVAGRKRFLAEIAAKRPEFERQQRKVGIPRAINRRYEAYRAELRAFDRFIKTIPTTRAELRRFTRYLLVAVAGRVGGSFSRHVSITYLDKAGVSYAAYKDRQHDAFGDLYEAISSIARRA